LRDKKTQNHYVLLNYLNKNQYAKIICFYEVNGKSYALVNIYLRKRRLLENKSDLDLDISIFNNKLDDFCAICIASNEFALVKLEKIITKCICIEDQNEVFLSCVVSLIEHD
jgi:hypothetical protein